MIEMICYDSFSTPVGGAMFVANICPPSLAPQSGRYLIAGCISRVVWRRKHCDSMGGGCFPCCVETLQCNVSTLVYYLLFPNLYHISILGWLTFPFSFQTYPF